MPRKYTKRAEYWKKFDPQKKDLNEIFTEDGRRLHEIVASAGEAYYQNVSKAYSRHQVQGNTGSSTTERYNRAAVSRRQDRFANISEGLLPWAYTGNYLDVQDTILGSYTQLVVPVAGSQVIKGAQPEPSQY